MAAITTDGAYKAFCDGMKEQFDKKNKELERTKRRLEKQIQETNKWKRMALAPKENDKKENSLISEEDQMMLALAS